MRDRNLLAGASCLALTLCLGASASAQTSASPTAGPAAVEEVIVTASRRSESIREVPTAVSAYSGTKLAEAQVASLSDLTAITPNVQISTYQTNANITIRGIGNGNFVQAGGDPGVAVHRNGVYLGQPALALSTFLDVERVEVLRGPQGTLFGRNATGGAVNIIPRAPTEDMTYGLDLSAGLDPTMLRSSGYVSGPLNSAGTLLARVAAEQNYNRGFTRNRAGEGPSRLDGNDDAAIRGQLAWRPDDDLRIMVLAEYARNRDNGPAAFLLGTPTGAGVVLPVPGAPIALPPGFPTGDPEARVAYANLGRRDMEARTLDLVGEWTIGGGSLKATASYSDSDNHTLQDGDGTTIRFTASTFANKAKQRYAELIYTSDPARAFTWVLGVNAYDEHLTQALAVPTQGYPLYTAGGMLDTTAYAGFAHGEYKIGPAKLFAGLRYSDDRKVMSEYNAFIGVNAARAAFSKLTYEAGLTYALGEEVTGYAKYATGYKSGGFAMGALAPGFRPETNASYEAGLKGVWLAGALQANLAAFHMAYKNLQVNQIIGLQTVVSNAARATINGLEIETVIRPMERLRIEASGAWLDATFDAFLTADSARPQLGLLDLKGNDLPGAPRFNASLSVAYDIPVAAGTLSPSARYSWKDRIHFSEFNIPISGQADVGKLDLFLNYKSEDRRWRAGLFATNVTDEQVRANVVVVSALLGSLSLAQYQPGRQVGVSLGYSF